MTLLAPIIERAFSQVISPIMIPIKDENNNMIPDLLEEKMADLKEDVSIRVSRVGEELKDVSKAIKEVGNQIGDIPKAATGKTRPGRKPQK